MKRVILLSLLVMSLNTSCIQEVKRADSKRVVKCCEVVAYSDTQGQSLYSGVVESASDVNLSFRVAGVIDRIVTREGAMVSKGDPIAIMDSRDYELQLAATQAEYDSVKDEVDRVVALYESESVAEGDYYKAVNGLKRIAAKLESHRNALSDTKIVAPFDGVVQRVMFDEGEAVAAGMPIVSFVSTSSPNIVINISSKDYLRRDAINGAVATIGDLGSVELPLSIGGIVSKANLNQLYEMRLGVDGVDGVVAPIGMNATVALSFESEVGDCLSLPFGALFEVDGESCVWVVKGDVVSRRIVDVCEVKRSGILLICGGLSVGERVVTAGVRTLKEGQAVSVISEVSSSNVGGIL